MIQWEEINMRDILAQMCGGVKRDFSLLRNQKTGDRNQKIVVGYLVILRAHQKCSRRICRGWFETRPPRLIIPNDKILITFFVILAKARIQENFSYHNSLTLLISPV